MDAPDISKPTQTGMDPARSVSTAAEARAESAPVPTKLSLPAPLTPLETREDLQTDLRRFHLQLPSGVSSEASSEWRPALDPAWFRSDQPWTSFPVFIPANAGETSVLPLTRLLSEALGASGSATAEGSILQANLWRFSRQANVLLQGRPGPVSFWDIYHEAINPFLAEFETSKAGAEALRNQMAQLEEHLPEKGSLIGLHDATLLELYQTAQQRNRRAVLKGFHAEVKSLTSQLADQLRLDQLHSKQGNSPEALFDALGGAAQGMIDMATLAETLPGYRGSQAMDPARRTRINQHLETLRSFLRSIETRPDFLLVHAHELPATFKPQQVECIQDENCLSRALQLFEKQTARLLPVFRAARAARLETGGKYRPELHDEILGALTWQSLTDEELKLIPSVAVLESTTILEQSQLNLYSRLLHSGKPIHVLLTASSAGPLAGQMQDSSEGFHPGWGYLSVAHREALVHQTTLVQPYHLMEGLNRITLSSRPAVALVETPTSANATSLNLGWLQSTVAQACRAHSCYTYDPDAGNSWATRFDLQHNPQADQPWPIHSLTCQDPEGQTVSLEIGITPAHWAALNPDFRNHFKIIAPEAWSPDQLEISHYLEQIHSPAPHTIPFLWVINQDGQVHRAILSRSLTLCCWDRYRHWKILQELAGIHNQYAEDAAASARVLAQQEFDRQKADLEAQHAEALEKVRAEAARATVDQLLAVLVDKATDPNALINLEAAPVSAPTAAAPAGAEAGPVALETSPAAESETAPVEEEEEDSFDDPYIDSVLCTTCNECTNLNPLLFKYNANKQAYIADPAAGTFAQLVKAAEKCPARCIHPGKPRTDDTSVTDPLLAKAAEFN